MNLKYFQTFMTTQSSRGPNLAMYSRNPSVSTSQGIPSTLIMHKSYMLVIRQVLQLLMTLPKEDEKAPSLTTSFVAIIALPQISI
jgi:hypothetical protein